MCSDSNKPTNYAADYISTNVSALPSRTSPPETRRYGGQRPAYTASEELCNELPVIWNDSEVGRYLSKWSWLLFFFTRLSSELAWWAKAYVWLRPSILASVTCASSCSRVASEAEHLSLTHCPFFFPALDTSVDTEGYAVYVTGLSAHKWRSITRSLTGGSDRWNPKHLHTPGSDTDKHLHTEYQKLNTRTGKEMGVSRY